MNKRRKSVIISTFLLGLFAHGYMFANKLPNYDDIDCLLGILGNGKTSGRWMLDVLGVVTRKIIGNVYSMPWFNGIICLILLAMTTMILIEMFDIQSEWLCAIMAGIIVTFPTITGMFFFMYTSVCYCLAILLTTIGVFFSTKIEKKWKLAGGVLIGVAIGIYQAYLAYAAAVLCLLLLLDAFFTEKVWKEYLRNAIYYVVTLVVSYAIYRIGLTYFMWRANTSLLNYQGIDEMGKISLMSICKSFAQSYINFFMLWKQELWSLNELPILKAAYGIMIVQFVLVVIIGCIKKIRKRQYLEGIYFLGVCSLFPVSVNSILIMCPNSHIYVLMVFSYVVIPVLIICIMNKFGKKILVNFLGGICVLLLIFGQCYCANLQYFSMYFTMQNAISYYSILVTSIRMTDGYRDELPIAVIGETISDESIFIEPEFDKYAYGGRSASLINQYSWKKFLNYYLGYAPEWIEDTSEFENMDEIKEMPCYPDKGGIRLVNDTIVIKLE